MRHGDEIRILVDGLSIRPKSLEPISISHGSQCWGIWVEPRVRSNDTTIADNRDFVISPIHPSLWPFAFRIEVALNSAKGTVHSICQQLLSNDVNILFMDQSPSGYSHSVFNAICAFEGGARGGTSGIFAEMQKKMFKLRFGKGPQELNDIDFQRVLSDERVKAFGNLGQQMIARLVSLWASLRNREQSQYEADIAFRQDTKNKAKPNAVYFLASRVVEQGLEPWFSTILDPDGISPEQSLLQVDLSGVDDKDKEYVLQSIRDADRMLNDVLQFQPSGTSERVEDLLQKLQSSHKKTRHGPNNVGNLTVQAKLAHMKFHAWARHIIRRFAWRHAHLPLNLQALVRLAEMRFWMAPYDPIEFHYDANRCLLCPNDKDRFAHQVSFLGKCGPLQRDKPLLAMATYSHEDRFVRLRFLPEDSTKERVRIQIAYKVDGQPAAEPHYAGSLQQPARSKGMLSSVAGALYEKGGNILRLTNSTGTFDPDSGDEQGQVRMAVEFDSKDWGHDSNKIIEDVVKQAVKNIISDPSAPTRGECSVQVSPFVLDSIFVSWIDSHRRAKDFRRILDSVAKGFGLETVYVMQNTEAVRNIVHDAIARCKYFLQIITPRDEEQLLMRQIPSYVPDFTWVTYELGCAVALKTLDPGRRCVQMIDQLMSDLARARLTKVTGDVPPISFRIDDGDERLRSQFTQAIEAMIRDP